jgi:hypothetical protein
MLENPKHKLTFEQMDFIYEMAFETMLTTLFETKYEEHGWTYDDFCEAAELAAEIQGQPEMMN